MDVSIVASVSTLPGVLFVCRFIVAAIFGILGVLVTYFFVPDMTGVDLSEEDARFMKVSLDVRVEI